MSTRVDALAHLVEKYNVPVPRYTSYPPANLFDSSYTPSHYQEDLQASNLVSEQGLSFYIHIPFCHNICLYCGCNKVRLSSSRGREIETYVEYLLREFDMISEYLDPSRRVTQIHFGGGSPTAIPLEYIERIITAITSRFALRPGAEVAIECHPGYLDRSGWQTLAELPFTRYSIGVQDSNLQVLQAVKRTPPLYPISQAIELLHSLGKRVNLDYIYGLPHQTRESFSETLRDAFALRPDRLVAFSYAHVPWLHPLQKGLEKLGLPSTQEKRMMYESTLEFAKEYDYVQIGMDHFVRRDDPLALAQGLHRLHRNFQGYCPRDLSAQVYALGVTGISQLTTSYAQNHKSIEEYQRSIHSGALPIAIGYRLSREEMGARDIITDLMCNYRTAPLLHVQKYAPDTTSLQEIPYLREALLEEMCRDGLCRLVDGELRMNSGAELFVRNVASAFDLHYDPTSPSGYSKPV